MSLKFSSSLDSWGYFDKLKTIQQCFEGVKVQSILIGGTKYKYQKMENICLF